jgi:hypothetical protein
MAPRSKIRFTLGIHEGRTGIGDQLFQTQLLYNLGRACGWSYVHDTSPRPWINRDQPGPVRRGFDYHRFLGLAIGEATVAEVSRPRFLDVDSKQVLELLLAQGGEAPELIGCSGGPNELVRIWFNSWFYVEYARVPARRALPCTQLMNLRRKYLDARRRDPVALPFSRGRIPIVVFLRLMDLVWYEEDGKIVLPAMFDPLKLFSAYVTPPAQCLPLVRALVEELGADRCELWVYSDGIPDRCWLMARMRGIDRYPADDIDAVSRRVIEFQQQQMRLFETCGAPTRFRVKSSTRLIREVIHAFSAAPFALARRAAGMAGHRWEAAFPDLGVRDPGLLPVVRVTEHDPRSLIALVRDFRSRSRRPLRWR